MTTIDSLVDAVCAAPQDAVRGVLHDLVQELGPQRSLHLLERAAAVVPAQRSSVEVHSVAAAVQSAKGVESLTRPLLEALHGVTGLASTYLTVVHADADLQEVRYSLNSVPGFSLPEGLHVPWSDTLCKRALDEGRPCTTDVPSVWGDSQAAADLSIQTYVSVPVVLSDGTLWGTLCGADARHAPEVERHLPVLGMFARLIAGEVMRTAAMEEAREAAEVDSLTGCASRRGIDAWLGWAGASDASVIAAVYVDLDGFKSVNDTYGHAVGDEALAAVGRRLRRLAREGDLVGRLGGDEFLVAAALEMAQVPAFLMRLSQPVEVVLDTPDGDVVVRGSVGTALVPPDRISGLLEAADRAMYDAKRASRR